MARTKGAKDKGKRKNSAQLKELGECIKDENPKNKNEAQKAFKDCKKFISLKAKK